MQVRIRTLSPRTGPAENAEHFLLQRPEDEIGDIAADLRADAHQSVRGRVTPDRTVPDRFIAAYGGVKGPQQIVGDAGVPCAGRQKNIDIFQFLRRIRESVSLRMTSEVGVNRFEPVGAQTNP